MSLSENLIVTMLSVVIPYQACNTSKCNHELQGYNQDIIHIPTSFIVITLAAKLVFFLKATCTLLLVVANVTIGKSNERFSDRLLVISQKIRTFAAQYR